MLGECQTNNDTASLCIIAAMLVPKDPIGATVSGGWAFWLCDAGPGLSAMARSKLDSASLGCDLPPFNTAVAGLRREKWVKWGLVKTNSEIRYKIQDYSEAEDPFEAKAY